jgi:phytoene dehydrogenase-like protein
LTLWSDQSRAAGDIARFSPADALRYPEFLASVDAVSRVLRGLISTPAPSIDSRSAGDLFELLKSGRRFRALGKADAYRLLRWIPMAAADLVHEWFESEPLCATVAAEGLLGSFVGPRSPGSSVLLLLLAARGEHPLASGWSVRGGPGALSAALDAAARQAGAEIRTSAPVRQIVVAAGVATGVVLESGEEVTARHVISSADPRHTLLELVGPAHLEPEFVRRVQNIRMRGTLAKINYAVSSLPRLTGLSALDADAQAAAMSGCVRLGPTLDVLERAFDAAKYGQYSTEPWMELSIPSIVDRDLAPGAGHVVSAYFQFAPYELRDAAWGAERERLGDVATRTIASYAPGFEKLILAREVITPLDLAERYALTGGHIFHGEIAVDQLLVGRPLLGWARYQTPIGRLFLCGSGTHPGTGLDGRSGALAAREIVKAASAGRNSR